MIHILELISLPQPIPSPKVLLINLHGTPIGLNGARDILHLEILVPHERPGRQTRPIQLQRLPKVNNRFEVLAHETVVVADHAAGLGRVFVVVEAA